MGKYGPEKTQYLETFLRSAIHIGLMQNQGFIKGLSNKIMMKPSTYFRKMSYHDV